MLDMFTSVALLGGLTGGIPLWIKPEKIAKQELAIFYKNIECVVNNRLKKTPFFSMRILVALSGVAMSEI